MVIAGIFGKGSKHMRQGRSVAVIAASAAFILGLTACTGGSDKDKEGEETPSAAPTQSAPRGASMPVDDGEYAPSQFKELDSDAGTAARQFSLMFYDWDSRKWNTDNPTGEEMAGEAAIKVMTPRFHKEFAGNGIVPVGIPMDFNAPEYKSAGSYVETIDLETSADEHTASETFQLWEVEVKLNIVDGSDDDGSDRQGITRSETLEMPAVMILVRDKKGEAWHVDDLNVERSW